MTHNPVDPTKPVRTKDGHKARIITTDLKGEFSWAVAIDCGFDSELLREYTKEGKYNLDGGSNPLDLENVPEKQVGYLNIYPNRISHRLFGTREEADYYANMDRIACVRVEYEEGQFDD